jgi:hypothetical protein
MAEIKTLNGFDRERILKIKQLRVDPLIKLKKFDGSYTMIGPGLDASGSPSTGLYEDFKTPGGSKALSKGTRRQMEALLEVEEGYLKPRSAFWTTFSVRMDSEILELDLSDDMSLLKYFFLNGQNIVSDGFAEAELNADGQYLIFSEDQEAKIRVSGRRSLKKAYALSDNLDIETKVQILSVFGINADASKPNVIEDKIDEKIEEDPEKFLKLANDENLIYRSLFSKCLDKGIITAKEGTFYHGEVELGYDRETSVAAIMKSGQLKAVLKAKLSGDMDLIKSALTEARK